MLRIVDDINKNGFVNVPYKSDKKSLLLTRAKKFVFKTILKKGVKNEEK